MFTLTPISPASCGQIKEESCREKSWSIARRYSCRNKVDWFEGYKCENADEFPGTRPTFYSFQMG